MDAIGFRVETPAVVEPWRKVLLEAASRLERNGWCQNTGAEEDGRLCVWIGIDRVTRPPDWPLTLEQKRWRRAGCDAERQFATFIGVANVCAIPDWNDTPGRTASEVTAALRACARS